MRAWGEREGEKEARRWGSGEKEEEEEGAAEWRRGIREGEVEKGVGE